MGNQKISRSARNSIEEAVTDLEHARDSINDLNVYVEDAPVMHLFWKAQENILVAVAALREFNRHV